MQSPLFSAGIFLNAAVSAIVMISAGFLVLFLTRRWDRLGLTMRAYAGFWGTSLLTWICISLRYIILSANRSDPSAHFFDLLIQGFIFLSGPPLLYYLVLRVSGNRHAARLLSILSIVAAVVGIWFAAEDNGLIPLTATAFSAETRLNTISLTIFNLESIFIGGLLVADLLKHISSYRRGKSVLFEALYPIPIIVYLLLGSVEQSGLVLDWPIVVFRVLYTAAFLSVYILMTLHESATETFLLDESRHPGLL